jgi:hypothetical protein
MKHIPVEYTPYEGARRRDWTAGPVDLDFLNKKVGHAKLNRVTVNGVGLHTLIFLTHMGIEAPWDCNYGWIFRRAGLMPSSPDAPKGILK